jgi:lysophospholipase L1-like esterase
MPLVHDSLAFHNVAELDPATGPSGGLRLQRFPRAVRDALGFRHHSRGRFFAHRASGCEIRFVASGPFVRLHLSAAETDATVIVSKGDHAHSRHHLPAGVVTSLFLEDPGAFAQVGPGLLRRRRFSPIVWRVVCNQDALLHYHGIESFGHAVRPPASGEVPSRAWLAYGSSITFGANAMHPGNAYVQQAAWRLGVDVLNLGLPGSALCEPHVAEWIAGLSGWDFATLELGVNLLDLAEPDEFAARARAFVETIHRARPEHPLHVINLFPHQADHARDPASPPARRAPAFNAAVRDLAAGFAHPAIRFIDGREILPDHGALHTDLVHPSDEGHILMGENLARILSAHLPCL